MAQKVYVDVDDTLVIWDYPSYVNQELVDILKEGLKAGLIDISIWSVNMYFKLLYISSNVFALFFKK